MEDRESDERVAALPVTLGELVYRRALRGERVMPDKPCDQGARALEHCACEERLWCSRAPE